MNTVLVISIGQSPDPCLASVEHHKANHTIFFTSQETRKTASDIEGILEFRGELVVLEKDHEYDFESCYQTARSAISKAFKFSEPRRIIVDITGGTKTMTAALALAASEHDLEFAYVVSEKQPDGKFKPNTERVKPFKNPLHKYHIRELERLRSSFNAGDFQSAMETIDVILNRTIGEEYAQEFFNSLKSLVRAYELWDLFNHKDAYDVFTKSFKNLKLLSLQENSVWKDWFKNIEVFKDCLFKLKHNNNNSSQLLMGDLLANADRRIERGEYDDAVARMYRAIDLHLELILIDCNVCIKNSLITLPSDQSHLTKEFKGNQVKDSTTLKLTGIYEIARLASFVDSKRGKKVFDAISSGSLRPALDNRNRSILAHGFEPINKTDAEILRSILLNEFQLISDPIWIPMPKLI